MKKEIHTSFQPSLNKSLTLWYVGYDIALPARAQSCNFAKYVDSKTS